MLDALLGEVVALQLGLGLGVVRGGPGRAEDTGDRVPQPQDTVLGGAQVGVAGRLDRERHDAVGEAFQVDAGGGGALAVRGLLPIGRLEGPAVPLRPERGGGGRRERDEVRPGALHEGQVEDVLVVDRVEGTGRQEREVLAVRGEGGRVVLEAQRGRLGDRQVGGVGELQLGQGARAGVGPGQPGRVGREDQPGHIAVVTAVHLPHLARLPLDEQQAAVVGGHGGAAAVGRHGEFQHPAERPGGEPAGRRARGEAGGGRELQGVVALGVRHPHHPLLAVGAERPGQPGPYAGRRGEGAGRAGAVGDPVDGAAYGDGTAARGVVGGRRPEPAGGVHRERLEIDALPAEPHVQPARLGPVQVVQHPQLAGAGVDDTGAVGGGVPGVETVEWGVPPQVRPVGEGGVERTGVLVVGQEGDALPHPHRVLDVAVQLLVDPYELPVALPVDPQLPGRASPVPLPPGGLASHRGGQQHRVRPVGDVADRPVRQGGGRSAVERDGTRPGAAQARLPLAGDRQDLAVGGPAAHLGLQAAPVGQPLGRAAVDRGDVHLGGAVAGGGPGDGGAVGRDAGVGHRHVLGADPPGPSAVERSEPHVVLGGEGDQVTVHVGEPEVSRRCGLSHPITLCRDDAARTEFGSLALDRAAVRVPVAPDGLGDGHRDSRPGLPVRGPAAHG